MKKIISILAMTALIAGLSALPALAGKPGGTTPPPTAAVNKVFTEGRFGEYCTDPAARVSAGYKVGIWGDAVPFKAQAVDANGYKVGGTFDYRVALTGETGTMPLADPSDLVYQVSPNVPQGIQYDYTVTVGGVTGNGAVYRDPAKCDACHATPPGHIADPAKWGNCKSCHDLGVVMHKHAYTKGGIVTDCYTCHPTGCLDTDLHKSQLNMWCTDCHGDLSQTQNGTFKISGMAGKPLCADCHDRTHQETTRGVLFAESVKHGGMLCISCHDAPHRVKKPSFDTGQGNNCSGCHSTQASDPKMGTNCGQCHKSSLDPHAVNRAK